MRRYARFSDDYINESIENYDNLEAAAEEMLEAYFDFCETQSDIAETYDLDYSDLVEVANIINDSDLSEAFIVRRAKKNQPAVTYNTKFGERTRKAFTYKKAPLITFEGDPTKPDGWVFAGVYDRKKAHPEDPSEEGAKGRRSRRAINAAVTRSRNKEAHINDINY